MTLKRGNMKISSKNKLNGLLGLYHHCRPFFIGHKTFSIFFSYFKAFLNIFLNILTPLFRTYLGIPRNVGPRNKKWCFSIPQIYSVFGVRAVYSLLHALQSTMYSQFRKHFINWDTFYKVAQGSNYISK